MSDIGRKFMFKFGLEAEPPPQRLHTWLRAMRQYTENGIGVELAGELAANALFPDYRTRRYSSDVETIEGLLNMAEQHCT